jgi:hypothetical protein
MPDQELVMPKPRGSRPPRHVVKNFRLVPPVVDPANFLGSLNARAEFHVKLLKVIEANATRHWKVETRDHKIGIIPETAVSYAAMVEIVEVNDCFIMTGTVQRQAATESGEAQTFFRDVEITRNFGTPTKAK